jgi:hypothetical protein
MSQSDMYYRDLDCYSDVPDDWDAPDVASVLLDGKLLARVRALHEACLSVNAYRISEFDQLGSVTFRANGPDADGYDVVRTDICMLNVYANGDFSWSAVYKHSSQSFYTERLNLIDLVGG